MRGLRWLLLFLPAALLAEITHFNDLIVFIASALSIVPLAGILGEATEALADRTGPRLGGLLNASLGNAAELIIALVAISAGQIELVRASITGSILGNLLLVLGFSMLLGGIKNGRQTFNRRNVDTDATMTILAVIAMSVPSFFNQYIEPDRFRVEVVSLTTASVIMILYILFVFYTLRSCNSEKCETVIMRDSRVAHAWHKKGTKHDDAFYGRNCDYERVSSWLSGSSHR
jgi:Ca2+:H+ antiporter